MLAMSDSLSLQGSGRIQLKMSRLQSSSFCWERVSEDSCRYRLMIQQMPSVCRCVFSLNLSGISIFLMGLLYLSSIRRPMKMSLTSSMRQLRKRQLLAPSWILLSIAVLRWPYLSDSQRAPTMELKAERTLCFSSCVLGDCRLGKRERQAAVTHSSHFQTSTRSLSILSSLDLAGSFLVARQPWMMAAEILMKPAKNQLQSSRLVIGLLTTSAARCRMTKHFQLSGQTFSSSTTMCSPAVFRSQSLAMLVIRSNTAPSLRPSMKSLADCHWKSAKAILRAYFQCLSSTGFKSSQL